MRKEADGLLRELQKFGEAKEPAGENRCLIESVHPKKLAEFDIAMGVARVQYLAEKKGIPYEDALRQLKEALEEVVREEGRA